MTKKEVLIANINNMEEEQINLLCLIAEGHITKRQMMETVFTQDELKKVDSAYPQGYQNDLIPIIGGENCPNFVYDYNENNWGKLVNIDRRFLGVIYKTFA